MEFWPADFGKEVSSASIRKKGRGKAVYVNERCLEPGSLGAATLVSEPGTFQWRTVFQPRREHVPRTVGKSLEFFPPTKSQPPSLPRLSVHQRAEQGARFLRTYHPGIDLPFELIKNELQSDDEKAAADSALNPYIGNVLAHSSLDSSEKHITHFLAFPSGETGSDLNVSSFYVTSDKKVVFRPSAIPASSFDTPIQQVVAFPLKYGGHCNFSLLGVRTHATLAIVKLQDRAPTQLGRPSPIATTIAPISLSETGGRRVVDVSGSLFSSSNAQALLVNDKGSVYNLKISGEEKAIDLVPNSWESDVPEPGLFWRVARRNFNTGMRGSSKKVQLFDLRTGTASLRLFDLKHEKELLTSIEAPFEGRQLMCFSTTKELVWIDERNYKSPVLSVKHQRAFDRTLRVETVFYGPSPLTILSSSGNALATVYDVNYGTYGHVHMYGEPSMLAGPPSIDTPLAGSTFFRHTANEGPAFDMIQLSCRGSLWRTKVMFSEDTDVLDDCPEGLVWSEDVHALKAQVNSVSGTIPPLGGREYFDANLRGAYEKIFRMQHIPPETAGPDSEAVYQTLERMHFFWQDMDEPVEHMLLSFDVAFRCGTEPIHASRADFLAESLLSSVQGLVALSGERVPIPRLVSTARWHHDLKLLPSFMVPDITTGSRPFIDEQREEALAHAATADGMKRTIEATQHLALDLALSRHIYASQSFSKQHAVSGGELDDGTLLSEATRAMSLSGAEPAPVHFGFLHPVAKVPYEDEEMESTAGSNKVDLVLPLGVRLLLSQWEVGADPQTYAYSDPYEESYPAALSQKSTLARWVDQTSGSPNQRLPTVPPVISAKAPPVVAPTSQPISTGPPASMFEPDVKHHDMSTPFPKDMTSGQVRRQVISSQEPSELGKSWESRQQKNKRGNKRMSGF